MSPDPTVQFNDLVFAGHAVVVTLLTYSQFLPSLWGFTVGKHQHVSSPVAGIIVGGIIAVVLVVVVVTTGSSDGGYNAAEWAWIDVVSVRYPYRVWRTADGWKIYTVGYIKLVVTVVKYIPQIWVNYKRQSTQGWSIWQILLDLTGGVLSILQLVLDSSLQADWSGLTGNPVKLGLGNVSIFFDLIFITQHYVWYTKSAEPRSTANEDGCREPLLSGR